MRRALPGVIAFAAAVAHLGFAWQEALGWRPDFVARAAPGWVAADPAAARAHIAWAAPLAFNMGVSNLMLATGLGWTAWAMRYDSLIAGRLATFFGLWMLAAALAALHTGVPAAFAAQGALGLALLAATAWGSRA